MLQISNFAFLFFRQHQNSDYQEELRERTRIQKKDWPNVGLSNECFGIDQHDDNNTYKDLVSEIPDIRYNNLVAESNKLKTTEKSH